jgi:hypothetical protein
MLKPASVSLLDIQQRFVDALLDPSQSPHALSLLKAESSEQKRVAENRLAFYRGNLTAIWTQALSNAFPVLLQLVGDEFFEQLARAFGKAYPSQSGDLNFFGAELPAFLAQDTRVADYPYFADVAALEWQVHRAYYAKDVQELHLPDFLAVVGEGLQEARLQWNPAAALHSSPWGTVSVWHAHQQSPVDSDAIALRAASYGLVTRKEWFVHLITLEKADFLALQALQTGETLGSALEIALDENPAFDIPQQLNNWFAAHLFYGINKN